MKIKLNDFVNISHEAHMINLENKLVAKMLGQANH